jgi:hypothetical protein
MQTRTRFAKWCEYSKSAAQSNDVRVTISRERAVDLQVGVAHEKEGRVVVFEHGSAELLGREHLHPVSAAQ